MISFKPQLWKLPITLDMKVATAGRSSPLRNRFEGITSGMYKDHHLMSCRCLLFYCFMPFLKKKKILSTLEEEIQPVLLKSCIVLSISNLFFVTFGKTWDITRFTNSSHQNWWMKISVKCFTRCELGNNLIPSFPDLFNDSFVTNLIELRHLFHTIRPD